MKKLLLIISFIFFFTCFSHQAFAQLPIPAPDSWISTGNINVARYRFAAAKISSGKVYIMGGDTGVSYLRNVEEYSPITNSWTNITNMLQGRKEFTAETIILNDGTERILAIGGQGGLGSNPGNMLKSAELYNPVTNSWTFTATDMPSFHGYHASTLLNDGKVLVVGGLVNASTRTSAVDIYDPINNSWTAKTPMPEAKTIHTATLLKDGRVFVIGGQTSSGSTSVITATTAFYNPTTDIWTAGPNLGIARQAHKAVLLNDGSVLAIGGVITGGSAIYSVEIWSPLTNSWTTVSPMINRRFNHTATILPDGKVLVAGGNGGAIGQNNSFLNTAEIYDPVIDNWELIPQMLNTHSLHTAALLNSGNLLVVGGLTPTFASNKSEYYTYTAIQPTPAPFLDLPWDYEAKGMNFSEAALSINSYFDHTYPVLSFLAEPSDFQNQVTTFNNESKIDASYSSHNGYDYGTGGGAKVSLGDDVLAASSGIAEFVNSCAACGNMIVINHSNGYQTKYMHLLDTGLITFIPGSSIPVPARQKIGEVGSTGNSTGAHIHFGVYQDKNDDENFGDNILDGLTDPFGWKSDQPDPWENYVFDYAGIQRTGSKSYYLWVKSLGEVQQTLTNNPTTFTVGKFGLSFPEDTIVGSAQLELSPEPTFFSQFISSIGTTFSAKAKDSLGNPITQFAKPFTLTVDFSSADISKVNPDTLSIYSSQDRINWNKELTEIDFIGKKASATLSHFTYFALMGDRKDTIAPTTETIFSGDEGNDNWFRSDVELALDAHDNEGGLGASYTTYKIANGNWQEYITPLTFSEEGIYEVKFYSEDNDGNVEGIKTIEFYIDKTPPEAEIRLNLDSLNIDIIGQDDNGTSVNLSDLPKNKNSIKIVDLAGNTLEMIGRDIDRGKKAQITIESLKYNQDLLINVGSTKLLIDYNLDKKEPDLKRLVQIFEIKGELKSKLEYRGKNGKTKIIIKENGQEKVKEEVNGIRILTITTQNGILDYYY